MNARDLTSEIVGDLDVQNIYALSLALVTLQDYGIQYAAAEEVAEAQDLLIFRLFNLSKEAKERADKLVKGAAK